MLPKQWSFYGNALILCTISESDFMCHVICLLYVVVTVLQNVHEHAKDTEIAYIDAIMQLLCCLHQYSKQSVGSNKIKNLTFQLDIPGCKMHLILAGKEVENLEALKLIFFFMFNSQKIEKLFF